VSAEFPMLETVMACGLSVLVWPTGVVAKVSAGAVEMLNFTVVVSAT